MGVKRYELSDAQWARIAPLLPGTVTLVQGPSTPSRQGQPQGFTPTWGHFSVEIMILSNDGSGRMQNME